jgi:phenylalanine-4-hydroxylase
METAVLSAPRPTSSIRITRPIPEQHAVWAELVGRAFPELEKHAAREYLEGYAIIGLEPDRLPNLEAISARLEPRTGWNTTPVSGFLPAPAFFEMLAARALSHHHLAAQPGIA